MVFRHGKSDWDADHDADHERPLNPRGEQAARTMGVVLARSGKVPHLAITSSARRARSTLELAMEAGGWTTEMQLSDDLYDTTTARTLEVIGRGYDSVETLMVVGHEPAWGELVEFLTRGRVAMKTAVVAGIDLAVDSWGDVDEGRGTLAYLLNPRLFTDGDWQLR